MARSSPYRAMFPPESKEASRSLVSGEVGLTAGTRRGVRGWVWAVAGALLAAAVLAALGARRELQVAALRRDVDALRAQLDALVKSAAEQRNLVNDLNAYEDGLYADLDSGEGEPLPAGGAAEERARAAGRAFSDRLDSITVLDDAESDAETDADDDDEDMYEEIGEESGSYQDYDAREKVTALLQAQEAARSGAGAVTRPSDDALGVVLSARPPDLPRYTSKMSELRRIMQRAPPADADAPPAAPDADAAAPGEQRSKRSARVEPPPEEAADEFAAPRLYSVKSGDRRKWKKYEPEALQANGIAPRPLVASLAAPLAAPLASRHELPRHTRNSDDEVEEDATEAPPPPPRRAFIAAHFHGNTSHLSTQTHEHYKGNGLLNLPHDAPHSVWSPAEWSLRAPHHAPRLTRAGHVHVRHTGIYLVYVQIYYLDAHDVTGWVLHRTSAPEHAERDALLQCAGTSPSAERREKPNSCFSASALLLRAGDRLAVRNTGGDRHSLMQREKSFVGLIKLADADGADDADS